MTATPKTRPAQIVFRQDDRFRADDPDGGHWIGRLLNPDVALDSQASMRPVLRGWSAPIYEITSHTGKNFHVKMRGRDRSGTRYAWFDTVDDAQAHGIKWAARRFRVPVEA